MADPVAPNLEAFLTPESMLTPGLAGGLTMFLTNGLSQHLDAPRALTGLVISAMCGLLVLVVARAIWQRTVYYILNTLTIFCVALGANAGATKVSFNMVSTAYAQTKPTIELSTEQRTKLKSTITSDQMNAVNAAIEQKINAATAKLRRAEGVGDEDNVKTATTEIKTLTEIQATFSTVEEPKSKSFFAPWQFSR